MKSKNLMRFIKITNSSAQTPQKSTRGRSVSYNQYNMHYKSKLPLEKECFAIDLVWGAGCPHTWEVVPGLWAEGFTMQEG